MKKARIYAGLRPFEKIFKNNFFRVLQNFGGHGLIQLFKGTRGQPLRPKLNMKIFPKVGVPYR